MWVWERVLRKESGKGYSSTTKASYSPILADMVCVSVVEVFKAGVRTQPLDIGTI